MAKLIAKSAGEGLLPVRVGGTKLSGAQPARITSIAPWPGKEKAVASALKKLGLDWPAPDRAVTGDKTAVLWSGRSQAFLINAAPEGLEAAAALTDQSDGWACLALDGAEAGAVLARLVPIDLSPATFPEGATARTLLGHMSLLIHRPGATLFHLYIFRSMVASAVHEIESVMKAVDARVRTC